MCVNELDEHNIFYSLLQFVAREIIFSSCKDYFFDSHSNFGKVLHVVVIEEVLPFIPPTTTKQH